MKSFLSFLPRFCPVSVFSMFSVLFLAVGNSWAYSLPSTPTPPSTPSSSDSSEGTTAANIDGAYLAQNSAAGDLTAQKISNSGAGSFTVITGGKKYTFQPVSYAGSSGQSITGKSGETDDEGKNYVPPADEAVLTESGMGIAVDYSHANFSANSIINGTQRKSDVFRVTLLYGQDFGSWDYTFSMPIKNQDNNGDFEAFNNSSIGLAVLPKYHVLLQQVHGLSFDVGAVFGYEYHWYKHKSKLTDSSGEFALGSFDNPSSFQAGPVALLGWTKGGTSLSGGVSYIDFRNLSGENAYGKNSALTNVGIGIQQAVWKGGAVGFDYIHTRLHNISSADLDYNKASLLLKQCIGSGNSLSLKMSRIFSNADYREIDTMLVFTHQL